MIPPQLRLNLNYMRLKITDMSEILILWLCLAFSALNAETSNQPTFYVESGEVSFVLKATGHEVAGKADNLQGEVSLPTKLTGHEHAMTGTFSIKAVELDTGNRRRDKKMRAETLEVKKFPSIEFKLQKIRGDLSKLSSAQSLPLRLEGQLTIRDVTNQVSIGGLVSFVKGKMILKAEHTLNWHDDFKVPDPSILFLRVNPQLTFQVSAVIATRN